MPFPTIDEVQALFRLLPKLDQADVDKAVAAAGKTLGSEKSSALRENLNVNFHNYFVERLWALWHAKAPAAQTAAQLKRIGAAADKLARLLELSDSKGAKQKGRLNELHRMVLTTQANLYAEEIGGFPDMPARMFDAVVYKDKRIQRADYRGDEKLGQLLDSLELWQKIIHRAHVYERKKVTAPGEKKRREPNKPMHTLFCMLNSAWSDAFDEIPSDGWNPLTGKADGPYFRFLGSVFESTRSRLDSRLIRQYPDLAKDLKLTPNAIRARFRNTAEAKLPALAKRLMA